MERCYEIVGFPLKRKDEEYLSPINALLSHIAPEKEAYVKVVFQKRIEHQKTGRELSVLKCYICTDETCGLDTPRILESYGFVTVDTNEESFVFGLKSSFIVQRRVVIDPVDNSLSYDPIQRFVATPALNYIFTNLSEGSGVMIWLGHLQEVVSDVNLLSAQEGLRASVERITVYQSHLDEIIAHNKGFCAMAFTFGNERDQVAIARELSFSVDGWDSFCLEKQIELNDQNISRFALREFRTKEADSTLRECASGLVMHDKTLSLLQRVVTEQELEVVTEAIDSLFQNDLLGANLNALWTLDAKSFFACRTSEKNLELGRSLFYEDERYYLSRNKLRQGLLIVGAPGSGKGNQLFRLIEELTDVPLLIFESAKQEMHHLRKVVTDLQTWRPEPGQFLFNPFEIPEGITLSEYRDSLIQILRTCFRLDGPLEELFTSTLNRCFYMNGYSESAKSNDSTVTRWGLHEFIIEYGKMINNSGYSQRTKDDMRQAGLTRLKALLDSNPDVYDTDHSINILELLGEEEGKKHNLIQLNSLPTIDAKQSFATMLLIALGTYMQLRFKHCSDPNDLKLLIIMDESHNLLKTVNGVNGEAYSFADDFANLMLTLRSVGVGFIISDQSTYNIPKVISDMCDTKMFMGSSKFSGIADNLEFLGADDQVMKNIYRLSPGQGIFSVSNAPHGVFFKTANRIDEFHIEEEIECVNSFISDSANKKAATFVECKKCPYRQNESMCKLEHKQKERTDAHRLLLEIGNPNKFLRAQFEKEKRSMDYSQLPHETKIRALGLFLKNNEVVAKAENKVCLVIQWIRMCNLEYRDLFSEKDLQNLIDIIGGR